MLEILCVLLGESNFGGRIIVSIVWRVARIVWRVVRIVWRVVRIVWRVVCIVWRVVFAR